ncbi:hypothetical protein DACRYDRAFT_23152 [Dacryopinax primogenitus]|uniref:Transmembrane protein n=1 Tax=Dacryopinax primogenitus (strain DJM 731) TaxID=1858805 RepID=M5FT97_DACPD|nr:uncharacterized protein DACRYDRAFT_23152 [Dacryopinax primogenitus]EJU00831.1 hypothetical protein DACRYDRAFT_23152 [Dacryopinax primogenitus]
MQFTKFISFALAFLSLGMLAMAAPLTKDVALAARCNCNDDQVLDVLVDLDAQVKADVAVIAALVAKGDVNIADYEAAIVTLTAHINAVVEVFVQLPGLEVGVQAEAIAQACADILIAIFAVLNTCLFVPSFLSCPSLAGLDAAISGLLVALNVCASGVLSIVIGLCLNIQLILTVNLVVFVKTIAVLLPLGL